jgi:chromosome partitioning protein
VNLGAAIALMGKRVCLVDMDPQSHLSLHLGIDGDSVGDTVYELLIEPDVHLENVLVKVRPNLVCVPSKIDLAALESELSQASDRHVRLAREFAPHMGDFDYILLDCPPSLGLLALNALAMATEIFVPMQGHFLAMQGVGKLLETVGLVCQSINPEIRVSGIILCMHEKQATHVREVVSELDDFFEEHRGGPVPWADARVLRPAIRKNIKLAEAPSFGQTIFDYAPWCAGAIDYRTLAERVVAQHESESDSSAKPLPKPTAVEPREVSAQGDQQAEQEESRPAVEAGTLSVEPRESADGTSENGH